MKALKMKKKKEQSKQKKWLERIESKGKAEK